MGKSEVARLRKALRELTPRQRHIFRESFAGEPNHKALAIGMASPFALFRWNCATRSSTARVGPRAETCSHPAPCACLRVREAITDATFSLPDARLMAMTTEPLEDDEMDPILVEAVDWFIRLTSGEATQDDADGLAAWRAQSAAHEAAFQSLTGLRTVSRAMGREGDTIHRRGIFVGGAAVLAGVATYGLARPPLGLWPSFAELTADHRTGLGQQFDFEPMTGVHVAMNARTSVSVADQGRAIRLIRGEAFISVAHRKTPFVVDTQLARVETFESRFNLRSLGGAVEVTCVAGALLCRRAGRRDSVQAGEALAIKSDGRPALAAAGSRGRDRLAPGAADLQGNAFVGGGRADQPLPSGPHHLDQRRGRPASGGGNLPHQPDRERGGSDPATARAEPPTATWRHCPDRLAFLCRSRRARERRNRGRRSAACAPGVFWPGTRPEE